MGVIERVTGPVTNPPPLRTIVHTFLKCNQVRNVVEVYENRFSRRFNPGCRPRQRLVLGGLNNLERRFFIWLNERVKEEGKIQ